MVSVITEFKLDFTAHLQKCDLPSYQKAAAAFSQTVPNAPLNIEFRNKRPGVFIIQTFNDNDAKKLEDKNVTFYHGKNENKQVNVKLEKLPIMVSTVAKSATSGNTPHAVAHSNTDNTRITGVGQKGIAIAAL